MVHVITHPAARSNPFCLVEGPVDAEINSALAVFLACDKVEKLRG